MTNDEFMRRLRLEAMDFNAKRLESIIARYAGRTCGAGCECSHCHGSAREYKGAAHSQHGMLIFGKGGTVAENGVFSAYASVFEDPKGPGDCQGDIVVPGAFRAHLGSMMPLVWQHDTRDPIGSARDLREDAYGLRFTGALELASARGREAFAFMKNHGLGSFSIGYSLPDDDCYSHRRNGGRMLKRIRLHEISLVTIPCAPGARLQ